jgi:AcrR family transcriptional regulator
MSHMTVITETRDHQTRGRIVEAAEALFKQYGYQKTTVADIAKKLGMSPANVYRFFASKKEINETVALRLTGEVEEACRKLAASGGTASDRLARMIALIHQMSKERYIDDVRMHEMVAAAMRDSWPIVKQHILNVDSIIASVIEEGMQAGEFDKGDPFIAARCLHTAIMRYSHPGLMIECAEMELPTLEQLTHFVLRALRKNAN